MSEPTPIDLPVGLRWVKLVCRLGRLVTDSAADVDAHPDLLPVGGTLTLTASPSRVRVQEADGRWRSVEVAGRTYTIRADGELVDNEGRVGVYIPDPASTLVEPQGYAITAAVKPTAGTEWRVTVGGPTVLPDVVDLVAVSSVGSISPSVTASFDARLYALEQGGGVDVSQAVEDYLTANPPAGGGSGVTATDTPTAPAEGQSASYLVTSAVTWPAGLVWSTDPDGGTAPTITGTALVAMFTLDGTTRAIMGATFPAPPPPPDLDAPVAGTLAVVPSSTSALGTVTGASDAVALDAAPYSFRLDAGAWSAWQASASYTWTGLTASTVYTFQHRVRDAAGNITEGTAVTDTTDAPAADSTPPTVGSMTATSISDTGFTVTIAGASDDTALDAAPYAFTIDGGTTWTAYQASATYTASGLTAETAYSVNWRVRDEAGNVSTGTAQTVTTTAGGGSGDFFTDFSADTTDAWPSGWSSVWGAHGSTSWVVANAEATGGKAFHLYGSSAKVAAVHTATGTVSGPVEMVCRFLFSGASPVSHPLRIFVTGSPGSENGYHANVSASTTKIAKYANGTSTDVGTPVSRALAVDTWSWVRLRVDSGSVKLRFWADGATEPEAWNIEAADSSFTSGAVALGTFKDTTVDVVGIAVGGGTAPKAA